MARHMKAEDADKIRNLSGRLMKEAKKKPGFLRNAARISRKIFLYACSIFGFTGGDYSRFKAKQRKQLEDLANTQKKNRPSRQPPKILSGRKRRKPKNTDQGSLFKTDHSKFLNNW